MRKQPTLLIPLICTLVAVSALAMENYVLRTPPKGADDYHARVRELGEKMPKKLVTREGEWLAMDSKPTMEAVQLLKPNVMLSRSFRNTTTGQRFTFMVVQCGLTRDMLGHYPPICYKGNGFTLKATEVLNEKFDDGRVNIDYMLYFFEKPYNNTSLKLDIYNFIMVPDGRTIRTNGDLRDYSRDYVRKFFGAGQIQVLFDNTSNVRTREERDQLFREVINANLPMIREIMHGHTQRGDQS